MDLAALFYKSAFKIGFLFRSHLKVSENFDYYYFFLNQTCVGMKAHSLNDVYSYFCCSRVREIRGNGCLLLPQDIYIVG